MHKHHYINAKHNLELPMEAHLLDSIEGMPQYVWMKCDECIDYKIIVRNDLMTRS